MIPMRLRLSLFRIPLTVAVIAAMAVVPATAGACPFCSAVSLTFSQEIEQSAAAVVARLVTPPPASALSPVADGPLPKGIFEVDQVLKGAEFVEQRAAGEPTQIEAILLEDKPVGSLFLLLGMLSTTSCSCLSCRRTAQIGWPSFRSILKTPTRSSPAMRMTSLPLPLMTTFVA
jgi:hypothetical protein